MMELNFETAHGGKNTAFFTDFMTNDALQIFLFTSSGKSEILSSLADLNTYSPFLSLSLVFHLSLAFLFSLIIYERAYLRKIKNVVVYVSFYCECYIVLFVFL